ncbi:glycosyltransferase family 9 protein [Marinomonas ostreistagni]|uniref:Glycosyltransferase family 9 protein n=1 Tax=Marinomonas ostreistagni TaxID=359209 RepID=A0ABS0Z7P7_9GAMM|nr:glycosyltransferase family 9 protein [Marinomonas ostreistagni]MBJ7549203.1 glycosyltransferase family 9 protein [Marinomonas ostreistagni]
MKILVVRNDKIGDFVLALPAFKAIKQAFPNATVVALVPAYTMDIAKACEWIDEVILDPKKPDEIKSFSKVLQAKQFDAAICLFSNTYNAKLVRKARIPVRVAPATKWVQFLYTHTLRQQRSKSEKPEYQYNLELADYLIKVLNGPKHTTSPHHLLSVSDDLKMAQKSKLNKMLGVSFEQRTCFIHPVTGGSSNTLTQAQWSKLIIFLNQLTPTHFVITAGPGESAISKALVDSMEDKVERITLYDENDGVEDFVRSIAVADLFIAGSTGPLHIAGALDVPTIGFYPKKRSSTPLRWQTLNSKGRWFPIKPNEQQEDLTQLDIEPHFSDIKKWCDALEK